MQLLSKCYKGLPPQKILTGFCVAFNSASATILFYTFQVQRISDLEKQHAQLLAALPPHLQAHYWYEQKCTEF
jgi:hypothetical protein